MTYQFRSETLAAQAECATLAVFEGDNEIAILNASSNNRQMYALIVMNFSDDGEECLVEEFFDDMKDAVGEMSIFLKSEYAGA